MFSKFLKGMVWIQEQGQKVPYASKVYGEYSVRKDVNEISHEDRWIVTHNSSGLSVKKILKKKDAELLCVKLQENMVKTWDGKFSVDNDNNRYYEFINEIRDLL